MIGRNWQSGIWLLLISSAAVFGVDLPPAAAQETPAEEAKDIYQLPPEGADIAAYAQQLMEARPEDESLPGQIRHFEAIGKNAEALMSRDLSQDVYATLFRIRYGTYMILEQLGAENIDQQLDAFLARTRGSSKETIARLARLSSILVAAHRLEAQPQASAADYRGVVERFVREVNQSGLDEEAAAAGQELAAVLSERAPLETAVASLNQLAALFRASQDEDLIATANVLEGTARRIALPGHSMEVEGTTLSGKPFDVSDWQGKVVLVDFWATWCAPCLEAMPTLQSAYDTYHDQGFEIVGINMDDNQGRVQAMVALQKLPWPILFSSKEGQTGLNHPVAVRYGVDSLPRLILIGRDGRVISTDVDPARLDALVKEALDGQATSAKPQQTPDRG